jgi:hypothetical protein
MPRIELDVETSVPPEKVIAALTDFSDRRPDIWPGLSRQFYEVYSVGETSAEVREGNPPGFWAKETYDWSTPGKVTWTVRESSFCKPGSFVSADVKPKADGGSTVHITWEREPSNLKGRFAVVLMKLTKGTPIAKSFRDGMEILEKQG